MPVTGNLRRSCLLCPCCCWSLRKPLCFSPLSSLQKQVQVQVQKGATLFGRIVQEHCNIVTKIMWLQDRRHNYAHRCLLRALANHHSLLFFPRMQRFLNCRTPFDSDRQCFLTNRTTDRMKELQPPFLPINPFQVGSIQLNCIPWRVLENCLPWQSIVPGDFSGSYWSKLVKGC